MASHHCPRINEVMGLRLRGEEEAQVKRFSKRFLRMAPAASARDWMLREESFGAESMRR